MVSPVVTTCVTGVAVAVGEAIITGVPAGVGCTTAAAGTLGVADGKDNNLGVDTGLGDGAGVHAARARANPRSVRRQSIAAGL